MKEKKLRIEDALAATKAAVEEGIVAGGGTALINAIPAVSELTNSLEGDEKIGANILLKSLEEPTRQIVQNAGFEPSIIVEKIKESTKVGFGFDAGTGKYVDMIEAGIVDPTKVTRSALENAASVASMILTTESIMTEKKEKSCSCNCGGHGAEMPPEIPRRELLPGVSCRAAELHHRRVPRPVSHQAGRVHP